MPSADRLTTKGNTFSMHPKWIPFLFVSILRVVFGQQVNGQDTLLVDSPVDVAAQCTVDTRFFEEEVWAKVGERTCLKCHHATGEASESNFLLAATLTSVESDRRVMKHNALAFEKMAKACEDGSSLMLDKVVGGLEHGGGEVLKPDSHGFKILERYVQRWMQKKTAPDLSHSQESYVAPAFFDSVAMISNPRLLRRVTLSLVGRLPTEEELEAVKQKDLAGMDSILDGIMKEETFFDRLKEGFNDIFLTVGIEDNAETLLSYDHFEKTRLWTQNHDLDHLPKADQQKARWKLADVYRDALLREFDTGLVAESEFRRRQFESAVGNDIPWVPPG